MMTTEKQSTVLLKGLILNPWSPSTALLNVELDVTGLFTPEEYMAWKEGFEDILNELDVRYSRRQKSLRGRRVQADYKTGMQAGQKVRVRVVTVQPYPSRFASAIGYIRTRFYGSANLTGVIEKYSQVIAEERRGQMVMQTRLVPEALFPKLKESMKELDKAVDDLQKEIDGYEQIEDFQRIKEYILRMVPVDRWSKDPRTMHARLHHIDLNPWPIVASADFIETFTDMETKRQIRESMAKIVAGVVKSSQKDLAKITETLTLILQEKVTENELTKAGKALSSLKKLTEESNTYRFIQPNIQAIEALLEAVNTGEEEAIGEAAHQAAHYFNVEEADSPADTLQRIGERLTGEIDERIKSLINASLGG